MMTAFFPQDRILSQAETVAALARAQKGAQQALVASRQAVGHGRWTCCDERGQVFGCGTTGAQGGVKIRLVGQGKHGGPYR